MFKISIIVPVYSSEENIKICLESILFQSFNNFEIICISEGKNKTIDNYIKQDSRIKSLEVREYVNSISSINNAVKISDGNYIMILDSKKFLKDKTVLYRLYNQIDNDYDILFFNSTDEHNIHNTYSAIPINNINRDYTIEDSKKAIKRLLSLDLYFSASNFIVKKKLYEMLNLRDSNVEAFKEYLIAAKLIYNSKKIKCLAAFCYETINKTRHKKSTEYKKRSREEKYINDIAYVNNELYSFLDEVKLYSLFEKEIEYYEYISFTPLYHKIKNNSNNINNLTFDNAFTHIKRYSEIAKDVKKTLDKKNEVDISIIIPVYNTEVYLKRCIDSIINQAFNSLEIIVVDDCSSGNCREIVDSYNNASIKYIRNSSNIGSGWSRINGLKLAVGKYIHFVDSDDYLADGSYEKIMHYLDNKYEVLYFNNYIVYDKVISKNYHIISDEKLNGGLAAFDDMFFSLSDRGRTLWARVFLRKCCIKAIDYMPRYNISMAEDWILNLFILFHVKKYRSVSDAFYYYDKSNPIAITNLSNLESNIWISRVESLITQYFIACNSLVLFLINKNVWRHYRSNWAVYISIDLKYHFIDMFKKFEENIINTNNNENKVVDEFCNFIDSRVKPSYLLSFIKHNIYLSNNLSSIKNLKYAFDNMIYIFISNLMRPYNILKFFFSTVSTGDKMYIKLFGFQITFLKKRQ